jgi:hypothetical protein
MKILSDKTFSILVKNSLVKKDVRWCAVLMQHPVLLSPKFRVKSHRFSRCHCKTVQCYAELTVWPERANSL